MRGSRDPRQNAVDIARLQARLTAAEKRLSAFEGAAPATSTTTAAAPAAQAAEAIAGPPGEDGADGASAYELAVAGGFVGTEAEWLASLVGEPGADSTVPGEKGDKGDPGDPAGSIFGIWAEENSGLGNNATEWAFGNGANTPDNQGIPVPEACELFKGALSLRQGTATVGIYRNGTQVATVAATTAASPNNVLEDYADPVAYAAGDVCGFRTVSASGTASPNQVTAWFRTT